MRTAPEKCNIYAQFCSERDPWTVFAFRVITVQNIWSSTDIFIFGGIIIDSASSSGFITEICLFWGYCIILPVLDLSQKPSLFLVVTELLLTVLCCYRFIFSLWVIQSSSYPRLFLPCQGSYIFFFLLGGGYGLFLPLGVITEFFLSWAISHFSSLSRLLQIFLSVGGGYGLFLPLLHSYYFSGLLQICLPLQSCYRFFFLFWVTT